MPTEATITIKVQYHPKGIQLESSRGTWIGILKDKPNFHEAIGRWVYREILATTEPAETP